MARRKKKEEVKVIEQPKQEQRSLFKVKALTETVAFRKYPTLNKEFVVGYMDPKRVYDVLSIITCAAMPFYLLENGSYVIGDGNLLKI